MSDVPDLRDYITVSFPHPPLYCASCGSIHHMIDYCPLQRPGRRLDINAVAIVYLTDTHIEWKIVFHNMRIIYEYSTPLLTAEELIPL